MFGSVMVLSSVEEFYLSAACLAPDCEIMLPLSFLKSSLWPLAVLSRLLFGKGFKDADECVCVCYLCSLLNL